MNRRRALLTALCGMLCGVRPGAGFSQPGEPLDLSTLAAFVDILLPADDLSPAASVLKVHESIADFAEKAPKLDQLLAGGTGWLNQTGTVPFRDLPQSDQVAILRWMEAADPAEGPHAFFFAVRLLAIEFYYADPASIGGFPLNPSPQPAGYPPPWI
ncbi:MAG: gluconate 2-dehydrogenase subunit 3 family protein [Paracoccaceae bacterium]